MQFTLSNFNDFPRISPYIIKQDNEVAVCWLRAMETQRMTSLATFYSDFAEVVVFRPVKNIDKDGQSTLILKRIV